MLLALIFYDRWIVVFTIDEVCSDIVVAVPTDGILGTGAAKASDHGALLCCACFLEFLDLRLSMGQGFDSITATYLCNLGRSRFFLSWATCIRTVELGTACELILGSG